MAFCKKDPMKTAIHPTTGKEFISGTTQEWFAKAIPAPTAKNVHTQLGVHFEEVAETIAALAFTGAVAEAHGKTLAKAMHAFGMMLKTGEVSIDANATNWREVGDGLADTRVTSVGGLYMIGADVDAIVASVDDSNFSKFVDGEPIFDENGKVAKGPDTFKPDVKAFIPEIPPVFAEVA